MIILYSIYYYPKSVMPASEDTVNNKNQINQPIFNPLWIPYVIIGKHFNYLYNNLNQSIPTIR